MKQVWFYKCVRKCERRYVWSVSCEESKKRGRKWSSECLVNAPLPPTHSLKNILLLRIQFLSKKNKCAASPIKKTDFILQQSNKKTHNLNPFPTLISHHPSLTLNDKQQPKTTATRPPATRDHWKLRSIYHRTQYEKTQFIHKHKRHHFGA